MEARSDPKRAEDLRRSVERVMSKRSAWVAAGEAAGRAALREKEAELKYRAHLAKVVKDPLLLAAFEEEVVGARQEGMPMPEVTEFVEAELLKGGVR